VIHLITMSKLRIEFQVTLLAVIIAVVVIASGYLAYMSLSGIVNSVEQEVKPDFQLFIIKDITADLATLENVVRLYILTDDEQNLAPYNKLINTVTGKLDNLQKNSSEEYSVLAATFYTLAREKLEIWQNVVNLHKSSQATGQDFDQLYSRLEEERVDTVITEIREQGGFLRGIFRNNKSKSDTLTETTDADTVIVEKRKAGLLKSIFGRDKVTYDTTLIEENIERSDLRSEIQNLEYAIKKEDTRINILESKLIERNAEIGKKLNDLILRRENYEAEKRLAKIHEADRLAQITYKRLAFFSAAAVLLLLLVIFLLFRYQKRSRAYQQALKTARTEAENLALAKERFAANVSHELRTPVNAIYSLSEQLYQQTDQREMKKQLTVLARSANHLKSIINDTLDFSKIQAKKLTFQSVDFSPACVFEDIISVNETEAAKKGILLEYNPEKPVYPALKGDPLRLKQILINLIGNAVKYTEKGMITVNLRTEEENSHVIMLFCQVKDTGIGIPRENIKEIFDEFVQIENKGGKKYSGTGLGLAIVKNLVELQGGTISVESEPGKGTTVLFSIPYLPGDMEKIEPKEFILPKIPEKKFKNLFFLIADDEEFNRYVLKNILKKWGSKFEEAVNGQETVDKALSGKFDIILMDMRMPVKNGLEAAEEILSYDPFAKIIIVSAADRKIDSLASVNDGIAGFLMKPFSEGDLYEVIYPLVNKNTGPLKQTIPKVELSEFKRLSNGDPVFLKEMIQLFIKTSENGIETIHKAVNAKDWKSVSEAAHKLAAPSKHLNADDLYNKLKKLEDVTRNSFEPAGIIALYESTEAEIKKVIAFLQEYLISGKFE